MKKTLLVIPALLAGCLLAQTGMAEASLYSGWSATPTVTDNNDEFKQATDILAAWHATDGDYHYFRIDIEAPPSAAEWTDIYGIYINSQAGVGANGPTSGLGYIPWELNGIDYVLDSHYNPMLGFYQNDFHYDWNQATLFQVDTSLAATGRAKQYVNGSGMSLEWKIAAGDIKMDGEAFTWYAASHGIALGSDTHDLTAAAQASAVPLPAGFWLLGSGLLGLAGVRRKRTP
ncbi:MAG: VPLPA-CTERM sorting domain-containing protein [Proteobacteria bacterium]|nr:VPLPA-CTERM sorting domain-containing protein [Pseudomonadota bacterium]MBU1547878.1 VPLPA-CTERM sorting domain-containing protein [Pseudomonadota bacterium]